MNVFELAASITLDKSKYDQGLNEAKSSATSFGTIFGANLASDAVKKGFEFIANGTKTVASGIAGLVKQSTEAYSQNEQLTGGVEKLYGKSTDLQKSLEQTGIKWGNSFSDADSRMKEVGDTIAASITAGDKFSDTAEMISVNYDMSMADTTKAIKAVEAALNGTAKTSESASELVKKNAQNAFKTAGMSANDYMDMATQFSASLISSLNGDAHKAAEITDVAMKAMSDNVNVFGSNMTDVSNAFKGFSKENYTMLDNLKLG